MNPETTSSSLPVHENDKLNRYKKTTDFFDDSRMYPDYHRLDSAGTEPTCVVGGRELVMLCSNNYLGLATHPTVLEGARAALDVHGTGPGGSRILCGNVDLLEELDRAVARFFDTEDAITFPTGYMANLSVFQALVDPFVGPLPCRRGTGTIICDQANHATVFDGVKLTSATRVIFRHNDLEDLERRLSAADMRGPRVVVVEGVYSLDSEIAPLAEIGALCRKYGAIFYVDDAHGIGVLGRHGGGSLQHLGLEGEADVLMGSFDKALGGMGGFLAGRRDLVRYLRIAARAYMFSSAIPAVMAGAMLRSLELAHSGELLRRRVRRNYLALRSGLEEMGFRVLGDGTVPVAPVLLGEEKTAVRFQQRLFDEGVLATAFRWPSVPKGAARIRVTPMATHRDDHIARALQAFSKVGRELR
ncbi:MAG: aminotransferase class I/II-fold pyridoxal phosphate-dependent enzyme, partial [Myxococcota bacterium]|nr:aminotransferase class I/II-fold pyridoxal phosphate-dependent enzyme [Myxococcota bacterium]